MLAHASPLLPPVHDFTAYLRAFHLEEIRKPEEYILELLSFCLLWNSCGGHALAARLAPFVTLAPMAGWRKRHRRLKPAIHPARAIFATLFLLPRRGARRLLSAECVR